MKRSEVQMVAAEELQVDDRVKAVMEAEAAEAAQATERQGGRFDGGDRRHTMVFRRMMLSTIL